MAWLAGYLARAAGEAATLAIVCVLEAPRLAPTVVHKEAVYVGVWVEQLQLFLGQIVERVNHLAHDTHRHTVPT